ncbi:hypothetical protein ACJJTC_018029, partial [Scirpophaga incertulas]
ARRRGVTAATLAARAALRDCGAAGATATATTGTSTTTAASTAELRLYAARVLRELAGPRRPAARWALVCAVLDRPPPADFNQSELRCPPEELVREAEVRCEQRCEELERGWRAARGGRAGGEDWEGGDDAAPDAALAAAEPGLAEWAAARDMTAEERRYWETEACALVARAPQLAPLLAPHHPRSAYLALGTCCDKTMS